MRYKVTDLIDIKKFQKLADEFYEITKIPSGLLDIEGNVLTATGWQDICTKFHRENEKSACRCKRSDQSTKQRVQGGTEYDFYICENGLVEGFAPIIVEGKHIANLFCGQFFFEEPDINYFQKQAKEFEFEEKLYLETLSKVPIMSKEKIKPYMRYYTQLAEMLSSMGLNTLKQKEAEKLLKKNNEDLENIVIERTLKLAQINLALEKDILKRKEVEKKLKESKERYKYLIELLPYGVTVVKEERILFANKTIAKYLGMKDPEEIIGRNVIDLIMPHSEYLSKFEENRKKFLKKESMPLTEERMIRKIDGKIMDMETVVSAIPYKGENAILVVTRDISERKKLNALEKKIEEEENLLKERIALDKLKTEFFANLSHELKTPINLIFSSIQLLELKIQNKNIQNNEININQFIEVLKQNCYRIVRLSNNLIDITKIDSGYFELDLKKCDIVNLIEDITLSSREYMEDKKIKLIFDTEVEEKIIDIDPDAMERILLNLLSNSVKFSKEKGYIMVSIYDKGENIVLSVKDNGIGIPRNKLNLIFDRFRQIDKSLTRNHEGSGIGLSLVKSLVNMHGGDIFVKSTWGQGTEFLITLPAKQPERKENELKLNTYQEMKNKNIEVIHIEFSDIY